MEVHRGAWLGGAQPVTSYALLVAVSASTDREHVFLGDTALWLYGVIGVLERVDVGVRHSRRLTVRTPVVLRRVSPDLMTGRRLRHGHWVVRLEVALVQAAASRTPEQVRLLLEQVLRERRTTVQALRATCRRGLAGSAKVRAALAELVGTSLEPDVRRLKTALEDLGVLGLQCEVRFTNQRGASCWADLWHEATRTALEIHGYLSHAERDRFRTDRRRDRWMSAEHGVRTLRIDAVEVEDDLVGLALELAAFLH